MTTPGVGGNFNLIDFNVDSNGRRTDTYTYDPYGQTTATAQNGSGIVNDQIYGYTGGTPDPTTGLEHLGHRWYDTRTGRFTQQDDIQVLADPSRANRYEYVLDDPTNLVDVTGQTPRCSLAAGIGAGLAGVVGGFIGFAAGGPVGAGIVGGAAAGFVGGYVGGRCAGESQPRSTVEMVAGRGS